MNRQIFGEYQLFWGDLHRQTAATCGEGSIRENLTVCHEEFGMDFCALTDNANIAEDPGDRLAPGPRLAAHRHFRNGKQAHSVPAGYWAELTDEIKRAHRPGKFVPFLAYEWCSARWGDRNVYYRGEEGPLYLPDNVYDLLDGARANGALVMPHHVGYTPGRRGTDWGAHDPRVERLAEIYSTQHGSSELPDGNRYPLWSNSMGGVAAGNSLTEALNRSIRIGFNGGTDAHSLRQKPGLTGIWARDLTREALWDAIWHRRTVASTGARIAISLTVEGVPQGSCVATDRFPRIALGVQAGERLLRVELIRHGTVIRTWYPQDPTLAVELTDEQEPSRPDTWYYVRVTGQSGEMAWSSPVWVSFLPEAAFAQEILYWLPAPRLQWGLFPAEGGYTSRLHHTGCRHDSAIVVAAIGSAEGAVNSAQLPVTLQPGQSAELFSAGTGPFRLTMQEGAERWTLLRHAPTL